MEASQQPTNGARASKQAGEHIMSLNEISKKIPQIAQHAGQAINTLTKAYQAPSPSSEQQMNAADSGGDDKLASRHADFSEHILALNVSIKEVCQGLHKETDALVEAGLLPEAAPKKGSFGVDVTNGGLGNLDIGYLNSRTRDTGLAKEAELVKELKSMLEKLVEEKIGKGDSDKMDES